MSPRYVQDLLHEAGTTFTERVAELRLQKARTLLEKRCSLGRRIVAIVLAINGRGPDF